jgi:FtsJ-like methyltransferase
MASSGFRKQWEEVQQTPIAGWGRAGAAPGGWTQFLAGLSTQVVAIDPADLDPDVAALPNVKHFKCTSEVAAPLLLGLSEGRADLLTCDMNQQCFVVGSPKLLNIASLKLIVVYENALVVKGEFIYRLGMYRMHSERREGMMDTGSRGLRRHGEGWGINAVTLESMVCKRELHMFFSCGCACMI